MITRSDIDTLLAREPTPGSPVLSAYLEVDQVCGASCASGYTTWVLE